MSSLPATAHRRQEIPPPFGRIVCGIDGSHSSPVAIEQAIALSGPNTALVFVCVRETRGAGERQATISAERADAALENAVALACNAGIDAAAEILPGHDPRKVLLDEASRSDLLVVASHGGSRAGGIALGSTASAAVHRAQVPVLVARRPPEGVDFPQRILVATDGSPDAARAVELTARIGHRHHANVYLLSVDPEPHGDPTESQLTRWTSPRRWAENLRSCTRPVTLTSASSRRDLNRALHSRQSAVAASLRASTRQCQRACCSSRTLLCTRCAADYPVARPTQPTSGRSSTRSASSSITSRFALPSPWRRKHAAPAAAPRTSESSQLSPAAVAAAMAPSIESPQPSRNPRSSRGGTSSHA